MSLSKNRHEAEPWLLTAEEDLDAAILLRDARKFAHCCFLAQQSGEKSGQGALVSGRCHPWGHSIQRLVTDFSKRDALPDSLIWIERAALLDKFCIPTRYPHSLPDLTPGQVYRLDDAMRAVEAARALVAACRNTIMQP